MRLRMQSRLEANLGFLNHDHGFFQAYWGSPSGLLVEARKSDSGLRLPAVGLPSAHWRSRLRTLCLRRGSPAAHSGAIWGRWNAGDTKIMAVSERD